MKAPARPHYCCMVMPFEGVVYGEIWTIWAKLFIITQHRKEVTGCCLDLVGERSVRHRCVCCYF